MKGGFLTAPSFVPKVEHKLCCCSSDQFTC